MNDLLRHMPDEQAALHRLAKDLLDKDPEENELIASLMNEGITESYAKQIIDNGLTDIRNKKDFYKMLIMGVVTVAGALLLNYMSYETALHYSAGGMIVFWGLVVAGIIMLIRAGGMHRRLPRY